MVADAGALFGFEVWTPARSLEFAAATNLGRGTWAAALKRAIARCDLAAQLGGGAGGAGDGADIAAYGMWDRITAPFEAALGAGAGHEATVEAQLEAFAAIADSDRLESLVDAGVDLGDLGDVLRRLEGAAKNSGAAHDVLRLATAALERLTTGDALDGVAAAALVAAPPAPPRLSPSAAKAAPAAPPGPPRLSPPTPPFSPMRSSLSDTGLPEPIEEGDEDEQSPKPKPAGEASKRVSFSAAAPPTLDGAASPAMTKYERMLKNGVPRVAVEAKMVAEGADPAALGAPAAMTKYERMLKNGVPRVAVEAKMVAEGADPATLGQAGVAAAPAEVTAARAPRRPSRSARPTSLAIDVQMIMKYEKMLKMGLPWAAVEQKMRAEGVDPALLGVPGAEEAPAAAAPKKAATFGDAPRVPMRAWHWVALRGGAAGAAWRAIRGSACAVDVDALEAAFSAQPRVAGRKAAQDSTPAPKAAASFIDARTLQNVGIVLAKLKHVLADVPRAVLAGDAGVIDAARAQMLLGACPSEADMAAAGDLQGEYANPVEKFFAEAAAVPKYKLRLEALALRGAAEVALAELEDGLEVRGCRAPPRWLPRAPGEDRSLRGVGRRRRRRGRERAVAAAGAVGGFADWQLRQRRHDARCR
ncbi:hypothetical protein M885DRAFT_31791 [Pelagophyceae sp. CCMP2097]|nr:hypothetical protein M885DRAFT_31791 [Pelagophyceae sp. CCMP2097]